jgi:hypothetical protein
LVAIEGDYVTIPLGRGGEAGAVAPRQLDQYLAGQALRAAAQRFDFKQAAAFRDRSKS